ncbi:MAG: acyl-CoA dehydrogenase family protein [Tistlia sp.]|uniref:acyl-CoA dehydrogenase family protein n=1 Tax=Tistlia sp. TaxID=3057121 RepID=UPI0034A1ACB8
MLDRETFGQITETLGRFVAEQLIPAEPAMAEAGAVPPGLIAQMAELGLFGMALPEEWGGLGLTLEEEVELLFILCRASLSFRSVLGINNGVGSYGILRYGSDAQKRRHLPRLASGERIAAFCLTEPDFGSDAASIRTSASRRDGGWVIEGTKRFITNAPEAGVFTVIARSDSGSRDHKGLTAFLVERNTPGLSVGPTDRKLGLAGSHTADVVFSDCRIPEEAILGAEGEGFRIAMSALERGRIGIAASAVGMSLRLIDEALAYAGERRSFGKPIGEHQLVQAMLADSEAEAFAARSMVLEAARRYDAGEPCGKQASCCKLFATEAVGRIADRTLQIFGGAGYMRDYPIEQLYRDVRVLRIYEGTSQIQQLIIARQMMRDGASPLRRQ